MFELILDILTPIAILVVGVTISCRDDSKPKPKKRRKWNWDLPWWLN